MRTRMTPSLVLSVTALTVALGGGTAFAAHYVITSTKQIKPSVRRALKGKTGPTGLTGPRGLQGLQGAQGPAGPAGIAGIVEVQSPHLTLAPGQSTVDVAGYGWSAACPAGTRAVGTGYNVSVGHLSFVQSYGLLVGGYAYNDSGITLSDIYLQAVCAQVTGTAAARVRGAASARAAETRQYRADLAALGHH